MNENPEPVSDPRVYMAAERTFLAWLRTGIAFMGFGFVIARFGLFLREITAVGGAPVAVRSDVGFSLPAGIGLIVAGIAVILLAALRHRRYIRALDRGQFRETYGVLFTMAVAIFLAIVGLAVVIYLAFLF